MLGGYGEEKGRDGPSLSTSISVRIIRTHATRCRQLLQSLHYNHHGASSIKCGIFQLSGNSALASSSSPYTGPRVIPNVCGRPRTSVSNSSVGTGSGSRWLIGHEISDALAHDAVDYAGMRYRLPFEKGFLTDWNAQKAVWDGLFSVSSSSSPLRPSRKTASNGYEETGPLTPNGIDTTSATLLVTEPYFNLPTM
ncbi:hypothetical protein D9619_012662 [Psilocybe cf. subviscida]|uniref:Uncharacterized protein n=1 Tax=Psilocybe cf. subviscida TaxID=2480587 RepID=A0A8H5EYX5_9AGAR|nr:hypothetical protein D9619_012662 [Psilocybe cf. subviscida]